MNQMIEHSKFREKSYFIKNKLFFLNYNIKKYYYFIKLYFKDVTWITELVVEYLCNLSKSKSKSRHGVLFGPNANYNY